MHYNVFMWLIGAVFIFVWFVCLYKKCYYHLDIKIERFINGGGYIKILD